MAKTGANRAHEISDEETGQEIVNRNLERAGYEPQPARKSREREEGEGESSREEADSAQSPDDPRLQGKLGGPGGADGGPEAGSKREQGPEW